MSRYAVGLNSHGGGAATAYPTKAAALRAAKELARANPGRLVAYYESVDVRGSLTPRERTRLFRADDSGRAAEV